MTRLSMGGERAEVSGLADGAVVLPAAGPLGTLRVRGAGSASFVAAQVGTGVALRRGGQQNADTAFYTFGGPVAGTVFDAAGGQIEVTLQSATSVADRKATRWQRYVVDVYDDTAQRFALFTAHEGTRLVFYYRTGGTQSQYWYVPVAQEETYFGVGRRTKIRLTWDGARNSLYLNDVLVQTSVYTRAAASWTVRSSFAVGATDGHNWGGGYYACDDVIDELVVSSRGTAPPPDTTLPVISNPTANGITMTAASVSWTTDEAADTRVEYGPTAAYGSSTALAPALVTAHAQALSALQPGTLYHYRVWSRDAAGNAASSGDLTFTTQPDTAAPTVPAGLAAAAVSPAQVNLSWSASTDNVGVRGYRVTRDGVEIGTAAGTTYADTTCAPATTYVYRVSAFDAAGNSSQPSAPASATTPAPSSHPFDALPSGHWMEVPSSHLSQVLPDPFPPNWGGPEQIIGSWCGGAYDTTRDRYLIWGGGHADWGGNEIYAFDVATLRWARAWGPTPNAFIPPIGTPASETYADGNPVARHTYDGLEYVPTIDRFFSVGGERYSDGSYSIATWLFDFAALSWSRAGDLNGSFYSDPGYGIVTAYDPVTRHVFAQGNFTFAEYDPLTGVWTPRGIFTGGLWTDELTAAIDPVRRLFVVVGTDRLFAWNLDTGALIQPTPSGDLTMLRSRAPGLDHHPHTGTFVAWSGGANLYVLDPDTWRFSVRAPAPASPVVPTAATEEGTFGRFRWVPSKKVFIVVSSIHENIFAFKP